MMKNGEIVSQQDAELFISVSQNLWESQDSSGLKLTPIEKEALEPLLSSGYTIVGFGGSRIVVQSPEESELSEYVIKLSRYGELPSTIGMVQTKNEIQLWKYLSNEYPLMPIVDWDYSYKWIAMEKGIPLKNKYSKQQYKQKVSELEAQFEDCDFIHSSEISPNNCVVKNGTVYLADYGILGLAETLD